MADIRTDQMDTGGEAVADRFGSLAAVVHADITDPRSVGALLEFVVKSGLIGLTRYLATYWAASGVRVNAISFGGVYANQPDEFVQRLSNLVPLGRMAREDEYEGAILFLCSGASSYMIGANLVVDGGQTCW